MNEEDKLRVLIPHWIEHNNEHADDFRRWAAQAGKAGPDLLAGADALGRVSGTLAVALEKLGGALPLSATGTASKAGGSGTLSNSS